MASREGAEQRRPSPEALLRQAGRAERSRLRVFMGAAPGVGKTYAMLEAAQERRREDVDVVVGVVETHGRAETQALLGGLEMVPKRAVEYLLTEVRRVTSGDSALAFYAREAPSAAQMDER